MVTKCIDIWTGSNAIRGNLMENALDLLQLFEQEYGGDDNPPSYTLTLNEAEMTYLLEVMQEDCAMFPDIPESVAIYAKVWRLFYPLGSIN